MLAMSLTCDRLRLESQRHHEDITSNTSKDITHNNASREYFGCLWQGSHFLFSPICFFILMKSPVLEIPRPRTPPRPSILYSEH
eukprot:4524595-Heterocapsa_arctica.AAC.1